MNQNEPPNQPSGLKSIKKQKSHSKKKNKKDNDGDSSTPIESDNDPADDNDFDRLKESTVKTEKLSSHLNTVREKYRK